MEERQKVAVITPGSFVIPSGRSSSVERVIEKIVPLAAEQLQIRIYGLADGHLPAYGLLGNVPCYRLTGGRRYVDSILRHLRKWLPDTVDVHNRPQLAYQLKARLPLARVFLTLHSTTFISSSSQPGSRTLPMLESVDGLIVNSKYLKDEIMRRFPSLSTPISVNPLGVSLEDFVPRWSLSGELLREARLADFGWNNRKIVLFIGRLLPSKGVHHLLEVFPTVLEKEKDAMLVIVGSAFYGVNRESDYVRKLKVLAEPYKDRVVFLPYVPYPRVADWYNLADILVVPSGGEEAFGLVNVEAMASAVPVVATGVGGIPEIVMDGVTGVLLSPEKLDPGLGDSILRLLESEEERRSMGRAGRELARIRFRWQHTSDRWVSIMKRNPSN
ncbi:spore coat protein SA [Paenibacillus anaericanus]|uniref:glycosyltransferase family 4 protein n=1 Tax=Paenibacillus anaericanus TaxID=170367 RepID=UPI00277F6882|nr:glycosyltransferase family 4 protein [Paenibacillus anaericanus]MDQ0090785.1 spore coat protein SA [Paenibacillus anaericanus]